MKKTQIDKAIEALEDERLPLTGRIAVLDAAIQKLRLIQQAKPKVVRRPRALPGSADKASA